MGDIDDFLHALASTTRQIRDQAQASRVELGFSVTGTHSMSGGIVDVQRGDPPVSLDHDEVRALFEDRDDDPMWTLFRQVPHSLVKHVFTSVVGATGPVTIHWTHSPGVDVATSAVGTLKVGRRRRKGTPPPAVALTDRVADNDDDEIRRLLAGKGHSTGFSDDQIAKAEAKRKVKFPPELRTFFSLVKKGMILGSDEEPAQDADEFPPYAEATGSLTAGTGKLGNVVDPAKRWLSTPKPLPEMPASTPDDVVQPLYATPQWIVFADDGGGNAYAVDLVPGPRGRIGQVVQFDHELDEPPQLVAWSLTDFLAGREASAPRPTPSPKKPGAPTEARLDDRLDKQSLTPEEVGSLTSLSVGRLAHPLDLGLLRGASGLATLEFGYADSALADLSPLKTLTGLEHLEAPPEVWLAIAEQGAWPPALVTATVAGGGMGQQRVELAAGRAIGARYGLTGLEERVWSS